MKSIKQICLITMMMMCFLVFPISVSGVVYVNKNATGANNGNSWANAYTTIQAGINDADVADEEVWVAKVAAEGTYPEAIVMKSGVKLYGGFNGTETELNQRNWTTNVTTIDASTARGGLPAYHVVIMNNITNATIDGFNIKGGNANGGSTNDYGGGFYCYSLNDTNLIANNKIKGNGAYSSGGGIYCYDSSSPAITNNIISGNSAYSYGGGGIYCYDLSSPEITNNTISGNSADYGDGGGISCSNSSPEISNNTISGNSAFNSFGGGIYCSLSSPAITNNTISGNSASIYGGGIYCYYYSSPAITNNTISGNSAGSGGGIFCEDLSSPVIINNTISGNSADSGGGIFCYVNSSPTIRNTIFCSNNKYDIYEADSSSDPAVIYNDFYGNPDGVYYDEGTTPYTSVAAMDSAIAECSNNIGLDPLFVGDTLSGGTWTAAPVYNSTTFQITLTNSSAVWTPDEHSGCLLNPNTSQNKQFVIVSNTTNTINVWGDVTAIAQSGDTYKIFDYHLQLASPCIDAGYDQDVPDIDFDGELRPMDVPLVDNNGPLAEYDIGADEYNPEIVAIIDWALY